MNRSIFASLREAIEEIKGCNYNLNEDVVFLPQLMIHMHLMRKLWITTLVWLEL